MQLTTEQERIGKQFSESLDAGKNFRVEALAGTGKTTALRALSQSDSCGIYLTFNRRNAKSAGLSCECFTWHGFAAQQMKRRTGMSVKNLLSSGSVTPREMSEVIGKIEYAGQVLPDKIARRLVQDAISVWRSSPEPCVMPHHVVLQNAEVLPDGGAQFNALVSRAATLVVESLDLGYGHADYLHEWATSGEPFWGYEGMQYVFVDEAQDLPLHITALLRDLPSTVVLVGDRYQHLNAWAGASLSALDDDAFGEALPLTTSFRFGTEIAETANSFLGLLGSDRFLKGVGEKQTVETSARLTTTNASALTLAEAYSRETSPVELVGADRLSELRRDLRVLRAEGTSLAFPGKTWDQVRRTDDRELAFAVRTLDVPDFGKLTQPQKAKISTIHRFKGLEADRVVVDDDVLSCADSPEKLMLAYVATTRARVELETI